MIVDPLSGSPLALVVLVLATGTILVVATGSGEQAELPFDTEGFD